MTADVELLPLPEVLPFSAAGARKVLQDWCRTCVTHATAAMDAEIEALRAEVERLTFEMGCLQQQYDERTAYMIVHRGAGLACSDAVRSAYSDEHHRAERLAEALRDALECGEDGDWQSARNYINEALRDQGQEARNG